MSWPSTQSEAPPLPWPLGMYATDDLSRGVQRMPRDEALQRAYIAPNPRLQVWAVMFDVDRKDAALAWDDLLVAPPNWSTTNPRTGHGHLGYVLQAPVPRSDIARARPLRLLARIQAGMTARLGADRAYAGLMTQTPVHPRWRTVWWRKSPYDLEELREWLPDDLPQLARRPVDAAGLGRNVALFDSLRRWAYRQRLAYADRTAWESVCLGRAAEISTMFPVSLPAAEVRATARSVAKWTWVRITPEAFASVQAARGRRRGVAISAAAMDLRAAILQRCG